MSANARNVHRSREAVGLGEPLYFTAGDHRLFGWLHPGSAGLNCGTGLVICKPFGFEAICSHKSVRTFAAISAAAGVPALRFDYRGTGDSDDLDAQANQLEVWPQDILAAIDELRRRTGVERVCLLGIRLGALLAAIAARQCLAAAGLILIAPITSGQLYVKELRTMRLAGSAERTLDSDPAVSDGSIEAGGYSLSAASLAALGQIDLAADRASPVAEILVIDGDNMPGPRNRAVAIRTALPGAHYLAMSGLVEMIMTNPSEAGPPHAIVAAARAWLLRAATVRSAPAASDVPPANTVLELRGAGQAADSLVTERPIFLGSDPCIFGILTSPRQGELRRRAVIFVNSGASYHVGTNRMYVSLARHWAARGYWVLRMDLAGLGDSGTRPGRPENDVFPGAALDDIGAAIEYLRDRCGIREITLCGFCSGAYHALRAAGAALPVHRILMVNLRHFLVKEGTDPDDLGTAEIIKRTRDHRERIFSKAAWMRLFAGQVNIARILSIYLQRPLLAAQSVLRNVARACRLHLPGDVGWELEDIAGRGVRLVFVFAASEAGIDLLRVQGGSSIKRLGELCRVHVIDSADHNFSQGGARAILEEILTGELTADNRRDIRRADASPGYRPDAARESQS